MQVRAGVKVLPRRLQKMAKQERKNIQENDQRRRNGITSTYELIKERLAKVRLGY